jgi:hypothetical protein
LADTSYGFYKESINIVKLPNPVVKRACDPSKLSPNPDAKVGLILDPSERFRQDDLVSIIYKTGDAELVIGYGDILNVQENKMIQVEVLNISREDILIRLLKNDAEYLKRIEVRPTVSVKVLDEYIRIGDI